MVEALRLSATWLMSSWRIVGAGGMMQYMPSVSAMESVGLAALLATQAKAAIAVRTRYLESLRFIVVSVVIDGEDEVVSLGDIRALIVDNAVVEEVVNSQVVVMSVDAELGVWEGVYPLFKLLAAVGELVAVGLGVHQEDGFIDVCGQVVKLVGDEIEVGHIVGEVEVESVSVEDNETDISGGEGEIFVAIYGVVGHQPGSEAVVITQSDDERHVELLQDVALHGELVGEAEVRLVAAVDYEVDVAALVDHVDHILRLVVPSLGVANHGKAHLGPALHLSFNQGDVGGGEVFVA